MQGREPIGIVNQEILEDAAWQKKLAANRVKFGEG
jgi:hypothetical protein